MKSSSEKRVKSSAKVHTIGLAERNSSSRTKAGYFKVQGLVTKHKGNKIISVFVLNFSSANVVCLSTSYILLWYLAKLNNKSLFLKEREVGHRIAKGLPRLPGTYQDLSGTALEQ